MILTQHQAEVGNNVVKALRAGEKRIIIQGAAGVGKTVLASELISFLIRDRSITKTFNNGIVFITAPTNKALAILQNKIELRSQIEFKTVHSALKMRLITNPKTGSRKFMPVYAKIAREREFKNCKIAIIDEASMINTEILEYLNDLRFPIIFSGDQNQINPIGEEITPVFNQGYPVFELTEIIRQGEGNPIIDLSRDLDMIFFKQANLINGKGYTYDNNEHNIIEDLAEVNGTDEVKYLAYMNKDLEIMNSKVRRRLYGERPKKIERGETIIFNAPYGGYYTNRELKVYDTEVITDYISVPREFTKYNENDCPIGELDKIKLRYYRINNSIDIIHEDSEKMFNTISLSIKDSCKRFGWNWKGFYWFNEYFADVTYNHALSIHKS